MQLSDVLCYVLLTVTVATIQPTQSRRHELEERRPDQRLNRRESSIFIEDFHNLESGFQKPKIIYRRLSRQRYGPPKERHGSTKPRYTSTKSRKPAKKYRGKLNSSRPKYGPPSHKKRTQSPKYRQPKRPSTKPTHRPSKITPSLYYFPRDSIGIGEPPANLEYQPPRPTYGEPPTDSYGAPINPIDSYGAPANPNSYRFEVKTTEDPLLTAPSHLESSSHFDMHDYGFDNEFQLWKNIQQKKNPHVDNENSYTNKLSTYIVPDMDIYVTPSPQADEEMVLSSDPEIYTLKENSKEQSQKQKQKLNHKYNKNKKPQYFSDNKLLNRPWKGHKVPGPDHEIIVGGQYAEPPARYVPKFQYHSSAPMYENDDDFAPQTHTFTDISTSPSSPYVNYKNSNLAFSPQNLNDAFSIVDK